MKLIDKDALVAEIERLENSYDYALDYEAALEDVRNFIDSMQEEPVSESINFEQELYKAFGQVKDFTLCMRIAKRFYDIGKKSREPVSDDLKKAAENYAFTMSGEDEVLKHDAFIEGAQWQKQKDSMPVSEDLEEAVNAYIGYAPEVDESSSTYGKRQAFKAGAQWQKTKDESTTEDLAEYINELSKQFPEVSFAKLSRIAVRVANWQKEQMMAKAVDGKVIANGMGNPILHLWEKGRHLIDKKVKVIVIKED